MEATGKSYYIEKTAIRVIVRFFDIIICSLLPLLSAFIIIKIDQAIATKWWVIVINIIYTYFLSFLYFVVLPWKWNGQTLGKKLWQIKLISTKKEKISFKAIMIRELFIIFIPWTLTLIAIFLSYYFKSDPIIKNEQLHKIIIRFLWSAILIWYLAIIIVVKIDQKHQLFFDRIHEIYVIKIKAVNQKPKKTDDIVNICNKNNFPGVINDEKLNEIENL